MKKNNWKRNIKLFCIGGIIGLSSINLFEISHQYKIYFGLILLEIIIILIIEFNEVSEREGNK